VIIVTGSSGFIGYHLTKKLLLNGEHVIGIDNHSNYYDPVWKRKRTDLLREFTGYIHLKWNLDRPPIDADYLCSLGDASCIIHLAAQPGVAHSFLHPYAYLRDNLTAFSNVIEFARTCGIENFIYASSSSVYGNARTPFCEYLEPHPLNLYGLTKHMNEQIAEVYSKQHHMKTLGLRLFTVYGPWYRPDMAIWKFAKALTYGAPVTIRGENYLPAHRDFTYVDDAVKAIMELMLWQDRTEDKYNIVNVGGDKPVSVDRVVTILGECLSKKPVRQYRSIFEGEMTDTRASTEKLMSMIGFVPETTIEEGIHSFAEWWKTYYEEEDV
jgi:UDP-glucuronate 4-epimerase